MPKILGSGDFRYEVVESWAKLPDGWSFTDVAAVAVDKKDRVYVFNRGKHPMIVFDRDGNFITSWGEQLFKRPHGLHIGADETLYCTDEGDHTVRRCTLEGKVLLEIGVPGKPQPFMSGLPFHRCTHTALAPNGNIYVADGYGNARVHCYDPSGRLLKSIGGPGTAPGEFNVVHNICCDCDGWVYVADRENHRIQVFTGDLKYETEWHNLHRPCGLYMDACKNPLCYVGEVAPGLAINRNIPNLGPRLSIMNTKGELLARLGDSVAGLGTGQFLAPHGLAVDSRGAIYVGEVSVTAWPQLFDKPVPENLRALQKLVKLPPA